jgi:Leucine-rich repeat (LRR) protein
LNNLLYLYFCSNQITNIPTQIANLINLSDLSFENNKIKFIPKQLKNLVNIRRCWINKNPIISLSNKLNNLNCLYIDNSQLILLDKLGNKPNMIKQNLFVLNFN